MTEETLLQETIQKLLDNGKSEADVLWVGSTSYGCFSWEKFKTLANKECDRGYGSSNVAMDLLIVGDNWWLERHEYDGSEWWEFKSLPKKPKINNDIISVFCEQTYNDSLLGINEELTKERGE